MPNLQSRFLRIKEALSPKRQDPIKLISGAIFLTIILILFFGFFLLGSYKEKLNQKDKQLKLQGLLGQLAYLDEVLTMSTYMAVVSGNLEWKTRYQKYYPTLSMVLQKALSEEELLPCSRKNLQRIESRHRIQSELEKKVFEAIHLGKPEQAREFFPKPSFELQKRISSDIFSQNIFIQELHLKMQFLKDEIVLLDETLTMAAKIASYSGNPFWAKRYQKYKIRLDYCIDKLMVLCPTSHLRKSIHQTEKANIALVKMEEEAFDFVSQNQLKQAQNLLNSQAYQEQKKAYALGMENFYSAVHQEVVALWHQQTRYFFLFALANILAIFLLLLTWFFVLKTLRHWRKSLETKQVELQEALGRVESISQAKTELLRNINHEIRTPLSCILGFSERLLEKKSNLPQENQEKVELIYKNAGHLSKLIEDFLDIFKIEAKKFQLSYSEFYLPELLQHLALNFYQKAQEKQLEFGYQPILPLPEFLQGDEMRLQQILFNLLGNAFQFTSQGKVELKVFLTGNSNPEKKHLQIHFQIQDTGKGIPKGQVSKIFLPFEQLEENKNFKGSGLGLYITQKLIHLMGGKLEVQTQENQGSLFEFILPISSKTKLIEEKQNQSFPLEKLKNASPTLLIVQHVEEQQHFLEAILKPLGFQLLQASNGKECLEKLKPNVPDLILLDLILPDSNGFELVHQIRQIAELQKTPILALSNNTKQNTFEECQEQGFDNVLFKPINPIILLKKLQYSLNLTWEYQKENPTFIFETISFSPKNHPHSSLPPHEALNELYFLSLRGDIRKIQNKLKEWEEMGYQDSLLLQKIRYFVREFDFSALSNYLKPYLKETTC